MQTVTNSLKLDYPLDFVLQVTHFDLIRNIPGYKKMLGMEEINLIRFDEHGDGSHDVEFTVKSKDRLPAFARRMIKPEMLAWRQMGRWDPEKLTFDFKVLPYFFQSVVDVRGRKRYLNGSGGVTMEISSAINIGIPGIGGLLEQVVAGELNKEQRKLMSKIELEIRTRAETRRI
ncbi:MAG TPA: DUF2505 family protein [bacterium]|nr:DUF2505 family protein [bacterium]